MGLLIIPKDILAEMTAHAREAFPKEACGVLSGDKQPGIARAGKLYRMKNSDDSQTTYAMDSGEQFRVMNEIKAGGSELVAIYHSHPSSPALPSPTDIGRAFFPGTKEPNFPGVAYIIVGLSELVPEVNAFSIDSSGVRRLEIKSG